MQKAKSNFFSPHEQSWMVMLAAVSSQMLLQKAAAWWYSLLLCYGALWDRLWCCHGKTHLDVECSTAGLRSLLLSTIFSQLAFCFAAPRDELSHYSFLIWHEAYRDRHLVIHPLVWSCTWSCTGEEDFTQLGSQRGSVGRLKPLCRNWFPELMSPVPRSGLSLAGASLIHLAALLLP